MDGSTHRVLEHLVGGHVAGARGVDPPAGRAHALVLLHHVHQPDDGLGLEVHVTVQGEQEGVLGPRLAT